MILFLPFLKSLSRWLASQRSPPSGISPSPTPFSSTLPKDISDLRVGATFPAFIASVAGSLVAALAVEDDSFLFRPPQEAYRTFR